AETALQAVVLPERLLQRMELLPLRESLDGAHLGALGLHREHQAGAHRLAVDQHGAGAAHAVLAAQVRAGEPAVLAQRVGEVAPRLGLDREGFAVDLQGIGDLAQAFTSRSFCRMRCCVTGSSKNSMPKGDGAATMA